MTLIEKTWTPISIHEMVAAFLQAERYKFTLERYLEHGDDALFQQDQRLIDHPDFNNPADNHRRLRLLNIIRAPLMGEIPLDTQWYRCSNFNRDDLLNVHVIARCGWDENKGDNNEVFLVAKRIPKPLKMSPTEWAPPILWGHEKNGPFTIIEGNNRLTAYASVSDAPKLDISVLVGLSPTPFCYHIFDSPCVLADDLWAVAKDPCNRPESKFLAKRILPQTEI